MKGLVKAVLYRTGFARAWHRWRNRDCLTVVMFHRVLPASDPRFRGANPAYTVTPDEFEACLRFFKRFYRVISLDDLMASSELSPCPLLITFDDGWRDNRQYALPLLQRHGVPALLFVATGHIGHEAGFWQEEVLNTARTGRWTAPGGDAIQFIATLSALAVPEREARLASLPAADPLPRRMMDHDDLIAVSRGGVALGGHGHSHEPMTALDNPAAEFDACRKALPATTGPVAFSFPHGRYSADLARLAKLAGFGPLFNSEPRLTPHATLDDSSMIGRIEMDLRSVRMPGRGLNERALAFSLITRPIAEETQH